MKVKVSEATGVVLDWMVAEILGVMILKSGAGPTPLIAAMRCLAASKLGEEVDVPEELL